MTAVHKKRGVLPSLYFLAFNIWGTCAMVRFLSPSRARALPLAAAVVGVLTVVLPQASYAEAEKKDNGELFVYNWYDFIAEDTVPGFEKKTGVNVTYDVYDSNEVLEAKLLSGRSGYDVVVPSHDFLANQIKAGVYEPLDKSKLKNLSNLNPATMKLLEAVDPGNKYGVPYLGQTTGIAINRAKVIEALGKGAPLDSWELVFNPEYMKKLEKCGVAFADAPTEIFASALRYMGKDPNSKQSSDYKEAGRVLDQVFPYVRYFSPSRALTDLANGEICVAITWSGEAMIATDRAEEAKNGVKIEYVIPKEGAGISYDIMAIPKDSGNKENAYKFINYILEPKVAADITDYVYYASPNQAATPLVSERIRNHPGIYPPANVEQTLFLFKPVDKKMRRMISREWTRLITGT